MVFDDFPRHKPRVDSVLIWALSRIDYVLASILAISAASPQYVIMCIDAFGERAIGDILI